MASLDDYLPAALARLGRLTIQIAPIERYESAYDPTTGILRIDPGADPRRALADLLVLLVDGEPERELVALAGGQSYEWVTARGDGRPPPLQVVRPPAS